jgi:sec-independent protein translocase protein TatA
MRFPGVPELLIILAIIIMVFGAGKITSIARDLGSGIREFKKAKNGDSDCPDRTKKTS